jgi:hypothetical protein
MFGKTLVSGFFVWIILSAGGLITVHAQTNMPLDTNRGFVHFPMLAVSNQSSSVCLFSIEAYRSEFRYLSHEFRKIDLRGPPVSTHFRPRDLHVSRSTLRRHSLLLAVKALSYLCTTI